MSEPRWSDADPRPLYRDQQRPPARRQPLPRERDQRDLDPRDRDPRGPRDSRNRDPRNRDPRGRDQRSRRVAADWEEPAPTGRAQRPPAAPGDGRVHWGTLPGVLGVCMVIGGAAFGALVSAVTSSQPGFVLSAFVVVATVAAALAVRPASVYRIIPVPALAYLVASLMTGLAVNQDGTTLTALGVGAAQWIASGFIAMIIATVIAIVATIVRWPRAARGPRRPPAPARGQGARPRPPRAPDDPPRRPQDRRPQNGRPRPPQDARPGPPRDDRPRWPEQPRIRRTQDSGDGSMATAAFPDWSREARNG